MSATNTLLHPAYDEVLGHLVAWGKSGLIPNTKVIKSYHPPIADPITGVQVLIPATTLETNFPTKSNQDYLVGDSISGGYEMYRGKPYSARAVLNQGSEFAPAATQEIVGLVEGKDDSKNYININPAPGVPLNQYHGDHPYTDIATEVVSKPSGLGALTTIDASAVLGPNGETITVSKPELSNGALAEPSCTIGTVNGGIVTMANAGMLSAIGPGVAKAGKIDMLSHAPHSGPNYTVKDFNVNKTVGGLDTLGGISMIRKGQQYQDLTTGAVDAAEYSTGVTEIYKKDITVVDKLSAQLGFNLPRWTDNHNDAKALYDTKMNGTYPTEDTSNVTETAGRALIPKRYDLVPTRVPCAMPGILNCHLVAYDSVSTTDIEYAYKPPNIFGYQAPNGLHAAESWYDMHTGDGVTTTWTVSKNITNKTLIQVSVNDIVLTLDQEYSLAKIGSNWTVVFASAPVAGSTVKVVYDTTMILKKYNEFSFYEKSEDALKPVTSSDGVYIPVARNGSMNTNYTVTF